MLNFHLKSEKMEKNTFTAFVVGMQIQQSHHASLLTAIHKPKKLFIEFFLIMTIMLV